MNCLMRQVLWMAEWGQSQKDARVEDFCQSESLPCLCHGRYDGVAGIAEFPCKNGERQGGLYDIFQGGIHLQAGAAQLVEAVRFLEGRIVRSQEGFQGFLRRLLTMEQRIFNQRGSASRSMQAPRRSFAALLSQPLTVAALSGCIQEHSFSLDGGG